MEFTPGEKYKYCNSGYYLLGQIIERVSGQSYDQFMQDNIFYPLGMSSTSLTTNIHSIPNRVRGYHMQGDRYVDAPSMSYTHLHAAGGLITNVDDLAKWDEALYTEKLISRKWLEHMFSPFILNNGETSHFALGWFLSRLKDTKCIYHGGGIYGFISHTIRLPEKHIYVALLSNRIKPKANPPTDHVAECVAAIVMGDPFKEQERNAIVLSPAELKKYAGVYRLISDREAGQIQQILFREGRLYFDTRRGHKYEILPESKTTFFIEGKKSFLTFNFNKRNEVNRMVVHYGGEGGKEIIFKKE
jgi:CubicO group peptidase (beta-lactamase class C family)